MNFQAAIRMGDAAAPALSGSPSVISDRGLAGTIVFPIRILHVLDRLDIGGTEKVVSRLIKGLEPELFEHSICTLRGAAPAAKSWMSDVNISDAGCDAAGFQFNVLRLAETMRSLRPTIVHSRNWGGIEAAIGARLAGVPIVVHSEHGYQLDMRYGLPLRQRILRHIAYRCAHAVFTVSDDLRRFHAVQGWWDPSLINVLPNGVEIARYSPCSEVRARVRRELGLSADALVVGFVGRLVDLKGVPTLLEALGNLLPVVPEIRALVVGSGPELGRLQDCVANSAALRGRVMFVGARDDVADLLKAMDIFVLPSLMEGMSNTILEAMATGVPVIATRVGGNPEIVTDAVAGYLFEPGDAVDLSKKLATLLLDRGLRGSIGHEARKRILKDFSLEVMLTRYRELYLGLVMQRCASKPAGIYVRN